MTRPGSPQVRSFNSAGASPRERLEAEFREGDSRLWLAPSEAAQSGFLETQAPTSVAPPLFEATQQDFSETMVEEPAHPMVAQAAEAAPTLNLQPGAWTEIYMDDRWVRTQLTWASPHGTLFMFTSADGVPHSMTRQSLDHLAAAGHLRLLAYPPAAGSSTEGQLWSRSSIFEVVVLGAATEEQRAAVRADLIARHTTAPLVVCDGDSLVAGNGVLTTEAWPSLLWERYGACVDVVNLGIPGRTAQQIRAAGLAPYAALARQASRRVLVLAAGINDLRAGRTPEDVYQDLLEHATAVEAAGWAVVLCTLAPSPDTETTHPGAIDALNDLILTWWNGHRADLQPVTSLLPDGLHYDAAGQADAAARIGTVVDDALS